MNKNGFFPVSCFAMVLLVGSVRCGPDEDRGPFRETQSAAEIRGSAVFQTYCVLCHGKQGLGDGRLAPGKDPPPANLTRSTLKDAEKRLIIMKGGAAVGRSPFMPPWGEELTDEQIADVIAYTNFLKKVKSN